jgi:hypothetical protein
MGRLSGFPSVEVDMSRRPDRNIGGLSSKAAFGGMSAAFASLSWQRSGIGDQGSAIF